jgi:hypothetical protein
MARTPSEEGKTMRFRRQVVITAEKTETYTVRQEPERTLEVYCEKCDQAFAFLTLNQAVSVTRLGARTIFRLVEAEELHASETEEGYLILCPKSVALFIHPVTALHIGWKHEEKI